jgi:transcriptional regulator with XRE-family HTH domain
MSPEREQGELLGSRVRRLRQSKGWTLAELGRRAGLAASTLSKVENNQLSLTYNNLTKLASGLGIDIAALFTDETIGEGFGRVAFSPRGEGRRQDTPNFGHEFLFAELAHKQIVPLCARVKRRAIEEFGDFDQHEGDELIYVLEGAIDIYLGEAPPRRMRAGDSCYFDARVPHAAISVGPGDALILSVATAGFLAKPAV